MICSTRLLLAPRLNLNAILFATLRNIIKYYVRDAIKLGLVVGVDFVKFYLEVHQVFFYRLALGNQIWTWSTALHLRSHRITPLSQQVNLLLQLTAAFVSHKQIFNANSIAFLIGRILNFLWIFSDKLNV